MGRERLKEIGYTLNRKQLSQEFGLERKAYRMKWTSTSLSLSWSGIRDLKSIAMLLSA